MRRRLDRRIIEEAWIERAIQAPLRQYIQADGRIRRWVQIPEMEKRHLRVILLADAETRDLDENTFLDVDAQGNICSITVEHASQRAGAPHFSYEEVAA
jgi:uncharacterized protein YuzE